jgi:hypothetical protein
LFRHSKVDAGGYTDTQQGYLISLLLFFQNKEIRLKTHLEKQDVRCGDSIRLAQEAAVNTAMRLGSLRTWDFLTG